MVTTSMLNDVAQAAQDRFDELVEAAVKLHIERFIADPDRIASFVADSRVFRESVREWMDRYIVTEVGNRLRCGVYDGLKVDEVFNKAWLPQFETAIKERIHKAVRAEIAKSAAEIVQELLRLAKET